LVNEYRRTWAQIIGGFGLLLDLYFTWRRVEIAQDQQVTERFTRAIDQLGATDDKTREPRLEIRLGGIYALERIAMDSPKRDYSTVMEVLTAYVRENAPWPPKTSKVEPISAGAPPTDIQAILTVIARRKGYFGNGETEPLDLQGTDLRGSSALGGRVVHLERAFLLMANLIEANLQGANLQGAFLEGAKVIDEQLAAALSLEGATMPDGQLYDEWRKGKGRELEGED
jgi:hypothetical protein